MANEDKDRAGGPKGPGKTPEPEHYPPVRRDDAVEPQGSPPPADEDRLGPGGDPAEGKR